MTSLAVLLPVYRPGARLAELAMALRRDRPDLAVLVVDDGSGVAGFLEAAEGAGATVLRRPVHAGKGAALKAGLRHIGTTWPGRVVVTADGDGQHRPADILAVGRHTATTGRIALGVRRFGPGTPLRSRAGNACTSAVFRAATGRRIGDTQTGLRAFPATDLEWLAAVPGDGFDYEMQVLLAAARTGRELDQVEVATTYLDGNSGSHFGALADSARVYRPLLRSLLLR